MGKKTTTPVTVRLYIIEEHLGAGNINGVIHTYIHTYT